MPTRCRRSTMKSLKWPQHSSHVQRSSVSRCSRLASVRATQSSQYTDVPAARMRISRASPVGPAPSRGKHLRRCAAIADLAIRVSQTSQVPNELCRTIQWVPVSKLARRSTLRAIVNVAPASATRAGRVQSRAAYCYPPTIADLASRLLLTCHGLRSTKGEVAKPIFERVSRVRPAAADSHRQWRALRDRCDSRPLVPECLLNATPHRASAHRSLWRLTTIMSCGAAPTASGVQPFSPSEYSPAIGTPRRFPQ